jgi:RHS repeat-associated protein
MTSAAAGGFTRSYNYAASDSPVRTQTSITGDPGASQLRTESYAYGPGGLLQTQINDQAPSYPITDRLGTMTGEVSDSGAATELPELDPFGVPVESALAPSAIDQATLGFIGGAGREEVPDSDLVKMGARMYDVETGAFVTRDPIVGEAEEPGRRVPYAYAFSNPAAFLDPDGLSVWSDIKDLANRSSPWNYAEPWIIEQAKELTRRAQRTIDDPNSSALLRANAYVSRLLTSQVTCDNVDSAIFYFLTRGRGGRGLSLRSGYKAEVAALGSREASMRAAGASDEAIARSLHAERRAIGERYKNLTPEPLRSEIYKRNLEKYGDRLGPSVEWLLSRGKSWKDIIESAKRTGGKDLGL